MRAHEIPELEAAGFNAAGVLAVERYDALVPTGWQSAALHPGARAAVVLGCGGRVFGDAFEGSPELGSADSPIDRFTARIVRRAAEVLGRGGCSAAPLFYWERRGGEFADFVALARDCGLGTPGRLGMLIHPVYGPWVSLRAVLLTRVPLAATPPLANFDPCNGCSAPCTAACPGQAVGRGGFDVAACARAIRARHACQQRCAARRACTVGRAHAYPPALERRFRAAVAAAR